MDNTIVLYPSPIKGHDVMVDLAKLITQQDPSISVIILLTNLPSSPSYSSSNNSYFNEVTATSPSISFLTLPAISPSSNTTHRRNNLRAGGTAVSLFQLAERNNPSLHQTLLHLSKTTNLRALVVGIFCTAAFQVSSELGIPTYYFYTSGAYGLAAFLYFPTIDRMYPENKLKELDVLVDLPGGPPVPSKDMPPFMSDRSLEAYRYFLDLAKQMPKSSGIITNTFESLHPDTVKAIAEGKCTPGELVPPLFLVGPILSTGKDNQSDPQGCLAWLDSQPKQSVAFLSFGSMAAFSGRQLKEIATGLERSGVSFLWVVRTPPEEPNNSELESLLPAGFLDRTRERGLVVKSWAPQRAVLGHESVGGFVTHCGWNSILEAVIGGVPMLAWPLYAEQPLNRVLLVEGMKVALPVKVSEDGVVRAGELEERLVELMSSEKGKSMRENIIVFKERAVEASADGGPSGIALANLVRALKGD